MVARKNSLERQEPRKKPREEPGSNEPGSKESSSAVPGGDYNSGQDVQTFIDDQHGLIIIITVVVQQVSTSGVNVSWLFHSQSFRVRERVENSR
jgi:hypothetical protein